MGEIDITKLHSWLSRTRLVHFLTTDHGNTVSARVWLRGDGQMTWDILLRLNIDSHTQLILSDLKPIEFIGCDYSKEQARVAVQIGKERLESLEQRLYDTDY